METKAFIKYLFAAAPALCLLPTAVRAQYYDQGTAPASIRWNYVETPHNKIIFPEDYLPQAARAMHYLDTVRIAIGHGYRVGPMRTPVVLQTHNFSSNGLVMRAPTRMELIVAPPSLMSPEPWLKQLVTHEARHTVQYNLMNRRFIRFASYLLGDQGSLLGVALFPLWAMEGDAVLAETELSTFGRGWQPSFTIEYRAMLDRQRWERFAVDKWFCGSYRDMMPDHYQWGYQLTSYAWTKYGENVWDNIGDYASRYPFLIFTTKIGMWKYYRSTVNRLARETLEDLHAYWSSLPARENSTTIVPTPITSYTTYSTPAATGGTLVAFKKDLDRPGRIVSVDLATGREKVLFNTGHVNSPLTVDGTGAVWSELRRSKFYEQKVNSVIRWANLETGRKGTVRGERQALFPTLLYGDKIVYARYEYDGSYTLRMVGKEGPAWRFPLPVSIHGLAADPKTQSVYFIAVDEGGMYIGAWVDNGGQSYVKTVKPATYATLSDLRAREGKLYFTSTQSGRDEGHVLDPASGTETRLTDSRYGSFSPSPAADGIVATTYTADGYLLATQDSTVPTHAVPDNAMPENVVNPPRRHWTDVPLNMDSITVADTIPLPVKRYRRGLHAINIHSWAPAGFDPDQMVTAEMKANVTAGVTALSQDLLNTTILYMRYGWTDAGRSMFQASLRYNGWVPKFEIGTRAGGGDRVIYNNSGHSISAKPKTYFDIDATVRLPVNLDWGAHTGLLQPSVDLNYSNALIYEPDGSVSHGLHKLAGQVLFSDQARMAHRDILPRWGYALRGNIAVEPFNDRFKPLWTGYVRAYTPGLMRHHSLMLRGVFQWQGQGMYYFRQKDLFPRGAEYNDIQAQRYTAFSGDYQFPVWCPDFGIASIVYFKRVRLNLTGDLARYKTFPRGTQHISDVPWQNIYSFGGDIIIDTNMSRAPAPATNYVRFSIYRPSDRKGVYMGFDISIPL